MRVIAGRFRGFGLAAPQGLATRPITDQAKESLFNILGCRFGTLAELPPVAVLDLFAGSGVLGLECLSRGAASCLFVEREREALRALRHNIEKLGVGERVTVAAENAWTIRVPPPPQAAPKAPWATGEPEPARAERLPSDESSGCGYGLIFVDPPYRDAENALRVLDLLERLAGRLSPDGFLVFRDDARGPFPADRMRRLRVVDERRFGRMRIVLLARPTDAADAQ